jgi:hypothetical protein
MDPKNIAIIFIIVFSVLSLIIYWLLKPPSPSNKCVKGDPGTCQMDKDCNGPTNGKCFKNSQGVCGCICNPGYSGLNCQTKGIPWNSTHCMGSNKWPARKDKNGLCVCPPGNWQSGQDPTYGYVQCLKCAFDWGPFDPSNPSPCTKQWKTANYLSNNCHGIGSSNACNDFNYVLNETGPTNQQGAVSSLNTCPSNNSCRCDPNNQDTPGRELCQVTGWLDPTKPSDTCAGSNDERSCSSYQCYYD